MPPMRPPARTPGTTRAGARPAPDRGRRDRATGGRRRRHPSPSAVQQGQCWARRRERPRPPLLARPPVHRDRPHRRATGRPRVPPHLPRGAGRAARPRRSSAPRVRHPPRERHRAPIPARRSPRAGARCGACRNRTRSAPRPRGRRAVQARRPGPRPGWHATTASYVGDVVGHARRQRLRQVAPGTVVGQHLVAARTLDRRGQCPRSGDLHLDRSGMVRGLLLERVEILAEKAEGAPLVERRGTGGGGQPPTRRLQVGVELGHQTEGATDHLRRYASAGHLREERQVYLAQHDPQRLVEVVLVGPREGADPRCQRHFSRSPRCRPGE